MDEYAARQFTQMRFKITDFRQGALGLNVLIQQLEGLARAVGESFWANELFPLVLDLERINSETIDKRRNMSTDERNRIEKVLAHIEELIAQQPDS